MKKLLYLLISIIVCTGTRAQQQDCSVVLNHLYTVVDSTTYQAILSSEIFNSDFAFAYERNKNWEGIYIIGQDNYIELFHPKSFVNESVPVGFSWICQASLVANCIEQYDFPHNEHIKYTYDENFDDLAVFTEDSSELMTTRELNKTQYESWLKKTFYDSLIFQTSDYNSQSESDSSKNYLFNNITGIQIKVNRRDSSSISQYLNLIGYTSESIVSNKLKFSNSIDFIELEFSDNTEVASVSVIYFKLNKPIESKHISIGTSKITIKGSNGKWEINNPSPAKPNNN